MHLYTKNISQKGDKIMTHLIYKKYKSFEDAKKDAKRQAFKINGGSVMLPLKTKNPTNVGLNG